MEERTPDEGNLSDLLAELRIFLSGVQLLAGFLIILPFNSGFRLLSALDHWVYLCALLCTFASLILLSAPAAWHRLDYPIRDRVGFKIYATHMSVVGLLPFSVALVLLVDLTLSRVVGPLETALGALFVGLGIIWHWWLLPLFRRRFF